MQQQHTVPVRHFTYSPASNTLVTEASDLACLWNNPRLPAEMVVQGARQAVTYKFTSVICDGENELLAHVFVPGVRGLPEMHVLND